MAVWIISKAIIGLIRDGDLQYHAADSPPKYYWQLDLNTLRAVCFRVDYQDDTARAAAMALGKYRSPYQNA
ncbi:uncharacterized protein N7473_001656 [Penicillium subrubescens]|uniref:uncharacterized protein n=1 Tax=Penicillium subrubescens TaxID=1316194 RepID=UPI00254557BD|nr:uncharacterized protein N7473_001656 [Penicillium subrubescens]KAJ5904740.1 hypothetical protein N7473_001656 [Penicillium subrubescens]